MSRTIKKDRYNKKSKWIKELMYKCRCEYCLNLKYTLRKQNQIMTYGQMIATIQCYIHHKKNVEVQINLPRNVGEIKKMQQMYLIASAYLNS